MPAPDLLVLVDDSVPEVIINLDSTARNGFYNYTDHSKVEELSLQKSELKNWANSTNGKTIFWFSILSTIFCCIFAFPNCLFTILAILFAKKAQAAECNGNRPDAQTYFSLALNMNVIALVMGLVTVIVEVLMLVKYIIDK